MNRRKKGMFRERKIGGQGSRNRNNKRRAGLTPEPTPPKRRRHSVRYIPSPNAGREETFIGDYIWSIEDDLKAYENGEMLGTAQLGTQIERNLRTLKSMTDRDHETYSEVYDRLSTTYEALKSTRPAVQPRRREPRYRHDDYF